MGKKQRYKFSVLSVTPSQKLITLTLAILIFVGAMGSLSIIKQDRLGKEISLAKNYGNNISSYITLSLSQSTTASKTLKYLYNEYDEGFFTEFDKECEHLMNEDESISSIYFSEGGVITYAYPPAVRESTIGFNMLEDSIQSEKALVAKNTKRITLAGPHELVEGGRGFIIRNPIYNKNDEFVGFAIIVIDLDKFFGRILKDINNKESTYKFGIWKEDNSQYVVDEYNFIFRDTDTNVSRLLDIKIDVPNDKWHLCIEPKEGWPDYSSMIHIIVVFIVFYILIMVFIVYRQIEIARNLYKMEHDPLTGLYTRSAFYRHAKKLISENPNEDFDVLVADIENFKAINGIYGNKKCDELLCYLADCYTKEHEIAAVARYGGDQFVMIYMTKDSFGEEYFYRRSKEVIDNAPIEKFNIKYGYYSKIDKTLPLNLVADRALLAARSILHNYDTNIASYDGPVSQRHLREQMLESLFEQAITNEDFKVWYQPKFDAETEKVVGLEALVRWIRSDGSAVSPGEFVYIFEDDGLIVHLDEYVFRHVCNDIKYWYEKGTKLIPVSVNVSKASLHHTGIINRYVNIIKEAGIPMESVSLELTESTAYSNVQMKKLADNLKESGFKLDMDDFGTGSSSLASLNMLPFDVIKLDKSLIDFIGTPDGEELVRHTIELAHFKKLKVVAEGVEEYSQLEFLRSKDCDIIQGYYYSKPLPYDECVEFLKKLYKENKVTHIN